jgi:hypothetical protein
MKKLLSMILFAASLLVASPTFAQSPNYSMGPVWRVSYYSIKPGMSDAFWKDFRENFKPLYEEFKKEGWITDYKVYLNPVTDHPGDWDVAIATAYPNWAGIDQLEAKAATVVAKHYGSREAAMEAAKKRVDLRELVASHLAEEVLPK